MHRKIARIIKSKPTIEGAGVHLKRAFGYHEVPLLDPFLLLDDFRSEKPDEYLPGFPWHPHRGIETVTYMLDGTVEHGDSMGNSGIIHPGEVQWMTAGSGIIHQEMPKGRGGKMGGFQLWVNLPSVKKMMDPRYREVTNDQIPEISIDGATIRVIAGKFKDRTGPVRDIIVDPEYLDVRMKKESEFEHDINNGYTAFAYVIEGDGYFDDSSEKSTGSEHLIIFKNSGRVKITSGNNSLRFLLISGKPIGEPVAWYGPIVMNTQEELDTAFREYQEGTFIKYKKF